MTQKEWDQKHTDIRRLYPHFSLVQSLRMAKKLHGARPMATAVKVGPTTTSAGTGPALTTQVVSSYDPKQIQKGVIVKTAKSNRFQVVQVGKYAHAKGFSDGYTASSKTGKLYTFDLLTGKNIDPSDSTQIVGIWQPIDDSARQATGKRAHVFTSAIDAQKVCQHTWVNLSISRKWLCCSKCGIDHPTEVPYMDTK